MAAIPLKEYIPDDDHIGTLNHELYEPGVLGDGLSNA